MNDKYQALLRWCKNELFLMSYNKRLRNYYEIKIIKNSEIWVFKDNLNQYEILNLAFDILTIQGYQFKYIKYIDNEWVIKGFNDYQDYLKYIKKPIKKL